MNRFKNKSRNLYLCPVFKKMNLLDKKRIVIKNKMCFNCLSDGHVSSECKSTLSCKSCHGKHSTLLCHATPNTSGSKSANKDKKPKFKKEQTTVNQTETESEVANEENVDESLAGLEVTSNNVGRSFELTSAETYYLSQQERIQKQ